MSFKVKQISSIHDLKDTIQLFKEKKLQEFKEKTMKSNKGQIKFIPKSS